MILTLTFKIVLVVASLALLIVSSIRDTTHQESYYYKGGTYITTGGSLK